MDTAADTIWLFIATTLVLIMQAGFLLLEGGRVRAKNSISVAQKNVSDLVVAWLAYIGIGFFIMYGVWAPVSGSGATGSTGAETPTPLEFLYQMGFCATAASIISGAVAERIRFVAYLVLAAVVSAIIYPLVGRAVWGNAIRADHTAWLADLGFIDFAGATAVHGVGACAGLVAAIMIGPRKGRFDTEGNVVPFSAHNSVLSLLGVLFLLIGWLGFNGGSLSPSDPAFQLVLLNTMTAAIFGATAGKAIGLRLDKGVFNPGRTCNGLIGGLVAVTAAPHLMSTIDAMLIGLVGGGVATAGAEILLKKFRIDDPVDVIATHGFAGIVGTLAVAFVVPLSALPAGSRLGQLAVQAGGGLAVLAFVTIAVWLTLSILSLWAPLRVTSQEEEIGLNYTEHGEAIGTGKLQNALQQSLTQTNGFSDRIEVAANDENSELAGAMNRLLDKHSEARQHLDQSEKRFRQFAETASDWLWETNKNLQIVYISENPGGDNKGSIDIPRYSHIFNLFRLKEHESKQVKRHVFNHQPTGLFEATLGTLDDSEEIQIEVRGVPYFSAKGEFEGYRGTITDVSPRKAAENRAVFLSLHDELTGLPNRRALTRSMLDIMAQADNSGLGVVIAAIDLDGFKAINDTYGHHAGDLLLIEVAKRITAMLRPDDKAFRTGGDEFTLVMGGFELDHAIENGSKICDRLISELSREYMLESTSTTIGASIGIAIYPEHASAGGDLSRLADLALYAAKSKGKGVVVPFESAMDIESQRRLELESDLRNALANDQLHLHYQPLFDTATERLKGFEALVRWQHPELGNISPAEFIGIAESLHIIHDIGEYVLTQACTFAASWQYDQRTAPPVIAVNVSPLQLQKPGFEKLVAETLKNTGLSADRLELEITEDALVHNFDETQQVLNTLRAMGISIAVDDFGSGQTSLRYLNQFPITKLKIDRSFIRHLGNDSKASEITQSIVALGRKLGISVIAEGVEDQQHLDLLRSWSCDQVQGFLFSKPVNPEQALDILYEDQQQGKPAVRMGKS